MNRNIILLVLGVCMLGMGISHAKFTPLENIKWPSAVLYEKGDSQTILPDGVPRQLQEAFKALGIDTEQSYMILHKQANQYEYARMGEGTLLYGFGADYGQNQISLDESAPMEGTLYSQPIAQTTESVKAPVGVVNPVATTRSFVVKEMTKPILRGDVKHLLNGNAEDMITEYIQYVQERDDVTVTKPFTKMKDGTYVGSLELTSWYKQVPYYIHLDMAIAPEFSDTPKVRYVLTQREDVDLRKKLQIFW